MAALGSCVRRWKFKTKGSGPGAAGRMKEPDGDGDGDAAIRLRLVVFSSIPWGRVVGWMDGWIAE